MSYRRTHCIQFFLQLDDGSPFPVDFHQRARFGGAETFIGYLTGNPLSLSWQRVRCAKPHVTHYLEPDLWAEVKLTIDRMPKETTRGREHYFRVCWLFSLLYLCGLQIFEVVGNSMAGFFWRRDKDGEERWWLEITGKGDKMRIVPATNELMVEPARYRREKGLAPLPLPGEARPCCCRSASARNR